MALSPEELVAVVGLGGAVIGALPGLIGSFITSRTEERKQFKELVLKAAMETWQTHVANAGNRPIFPLEHYIVNTAKMCEIALADRKINPGALKAHLEELDVLMKILQEHATDTVAKKQA